MKRCRLCKLPIVDGEDTVDDWEGYWAWHPKLHQVCATGEYQASAWLVDDTETKQALGISDEPPSSGVPSRAVPRRVVREGFTRNPT